MIAINIHKSVSVAPAINPKPHIIAHLKKVPEGKEAIYQSPAN